MASLTDILGTIQNGVTAMNQLAVRLNTAFPPITVPTSVPPVTAGAVVYTSSLVSAFGLVQTSSGGFYRIALLPSS